MPRLHVSFLRRASALGAFSLLTFSAAPLLAQTPLPPPKPGEPVIALNEESATLEQAAKTLSDTAKVTVIVPDEFKNLLVTVHFGPMPISQILETLLKATGQPLEYTERNKVYTIRRAAPVIIVKQADGNGPVTIDIHDVDVREAISLLMKQAKLKYKIDNAVPHMEVAYKAELPSRESALAGLRTLSGNAFHYQIENGVYHFYAGAGKEPDLAAAFVAPQADAEHPLDMSLTKTDVHAALFLLMKQAKVNFKIDDAIPHTNVTYKAKDVSMKAALDELKTLSGKAFDYKIENGVYHFYATPAKAAK